jgi:hypothetical protein
LHIPFPGLTGGLGRFYREDVMRPDDTKPARVDAWAELQAEGYDISLLEANLRKTPLERIRAHDRALRTALALRQAMEEARARARIDS